MNELQLQVEELKNKFLPNYYKSVDVDEGWYQIVVDCDNLLTEIDPDYQIAQIKQKFGGLRYYFQPSDANNGELYVKMNAVVLAYEKIASMTCEATGKPGVLMKSKSRWLKTLDPEYAKTTLFFRDYTVVGKTNLDNPNELMVGIEDYVGEKLDWGQNNQGIILPIESLRIIYTYLESVKKMYKEAVSDNTLPL